MKTFSSPFGKAPCLFHIHLKEAYSTIERFYRVIVRFQSRNLGLAFFCNNNYLFEKPMMSPYRSLRVRTLTELATKF
jgi:hypothetical protein